MSLDDVYEYYLAQDEQAGRDAISSGALLELRTKLGVSRSFMSELLQTSPAAYRLWERDPAEAIMIRPLTAGRIGRFYNRALKTIEQFEDAGYQLNDVTPLHHYAEQKGTPLERLMVEIRQGQLNAIDLGILGMWVLKDQTTERVA